jgi:hypothetical protein
MATHRAIALINDLTDKKRKAQANLDLATKFAETFSRTCWASDSNKRVWDCSCPQCKEIVREGFTTGELPWYCSTETE